MNLSMVTQNSGDEKSLDKEIHVDNILQGQEADNSVDMQAKNQKGDENCYEDGFHEPDMLARDIVSLDNLIINHVRNEFESLTVAGNGMFGGISPAEISSNVVKVCGLDKEVWGQHVIGGQLQKRPEAGFTAGNKVLHELDNAIFQGKLWHCVPVKQNTALVMGKLV